MDHPDWPALLAAIVAEPDDDTVRLVAADFLEEHGEPDRAAFIRIQVELARLEAAGQGKSLEVDHLRAKERAFLGPLSVYWKLWAAEACPELVKVGFRDGGRDALEAMSVNGHERVRFHRGFVEAVECRAEEWYRHGAAIRLRNPIRELALSGAARFSRDQWYAMMASLLGLSVLHVDPSMPHGLDWLRGWLPGVDVFPLTV